MQPHTFPVMVVKYSRNCSESVFWEFFLERILFERLIGKGTYLNDVFLGNLSRLQAEKIFIIEKNSLFLSHVVWQRITFPYICFKK